jgi:hypothetical protein
MARALCWKTVKRGVSRAESHAVGLSEVGAEVAAARPQRFPAHTASLFALPTLELAIERAQKLYGSDPKRACIFELSYDEDDLQSEFDGYEMQHPHLPRRAADRTRRRAVAEWAARKAGTLPATPT